MLLQWEFAPQNTSDNISKTSQFLDFFIRNASHSSKEVVRSNIEIFRLLCEQWKGRFFVSKKQIQDLLLDPNKMTKLTVLQVLGVLLLNGQPLFDREHDSGLSEFKFYDILLSNLNSPVKDVYCATSEVCGLSLAQAKDSMEVDNSFEQLVKDKLTGIFSKQETERGLNCLFRIGTYCPAFLLERANLLFSILSKVKGEFKGKMSRKVCNCFIISLS